LRPEKQHVIAENQQIMSLKKQFLKSKPVCKVTFMVDPILIEGAKEVAILGDFNNWNPSEATMRKLKDGSFTKTIELEVGNEYQFRYLVDGTKWINDTQADKFVHSGVAAEQNGIVAL
jgi:1,4-alpha-glucan branching enzyme